MTTPSAPRPAPPRLDPGSAGPGWGPSALPPHPPTWPPPASPPAGHVPPPPPPGWEVGPGGPERSRPPVGLQNLLLALGTALVAIAVVVFTAVNWSQLHASVQGLILVALTVVAGVAAGLAARHELPSTSEALAAVAVLLGIADVHAVRVGLAPAADPGLFWAGGLAVVTSGAVALGRSTRIRSPQIAASVLGQLPLVFVLASAGTQVAVWQLVLVAQAAAVLVIADRTASAPRRARTVGAGWALVVAATATAAVVVDGWLGATFGDTAAESHHGATAVCLAAAAALGLVVAWLRAASEAVRTCALLATTVLVLGAVWEAGLELTTLSTTVGIVALTASGLFFLGRRLPKAWGEAPAIASAAAGVFLSLPLVGAVASMLIAASTVPHDAWALSGSSQAASLQLPDAIGIGGSALAMHLAAVLVFAAGLVVHRSRLAAESVAAGLGLTGLVLAPALLPMSIAATVLVALVVAAVASAAAVAVGIGTPRASIALGVALVAYSWATPWSLATPGLTFATLAIGVLAALGLAAAARRHGPVSVAASASAWVVVSASLFAGLVVWDAGSSSAVSWAVAAVVAAVASIVAVVLLDPVGASPAVARTMARTVEATSLAVYLGSLAVVASLGSSGAASAVLGAGVIGFGLHAARPERRLAGLAAAGELLVLIWVQLGQAEVALVEAYTLPLALLLLAVGLVGDRLDETGQAPAPSWITFGPALVVALAPTVWLSFVEPGSIRPLGAIAVGAAILIGGVAWGKRALVDVGTATVVILAAGQLAPVVGKIPNWAVIGTTGIVLLAVGATFEQRRRDLRAVLRTYAALT